jgi:hypothetical protein
MQTITFGRDKKGKLVATQDAPASPWTVLVHFKGDKLTMEVIPPKRVPVGNMGPGAFVELYSTIFEAKVSGDEMDGKFYSKTGTGDSVKFKGIRQTTTAPIASAPKK